MRDIIVCELDIDGTIADIFTPIEALIKQEGYANFTFESVLRYDAKNSCIGCPRVVMNKWYYTPDIYNVTEPYEGAIEFIDWLLEYGLRVIMNTKCYTKEVGIAKEKWVGEINKKLKHGKVEYIADCHLGAKRMLENANILVEDSLENIKRSNADTKFIFGSHHNKRKHNEKYEQVYEEAYYIDGKSSRDKYAVIKEIIKTEYLGVIASGE